MMQTAPLDEPLTTSIADADSLRYYPGFAGTARDHLTDTDIQELNQTSAQFQVDPIRYPENMQKMVNR